MESFGFALFLSISSTSLWGGVFPFLPHSLQSSRITASFYIVQLVAAFATYSIMVVLSYRRPRNGLAVHAGACSIVYAFGSLPLIAAMYAMPSRFRSSSLPPYSQA